MKRLWLLTLLLAGCTIGSQGRDLVQARGATVALSVRVDGRQQILAGELIAVDTDALIVDSVDEFGQPRVVVRVPKRDVSRGIVYLGESPNTDHRSLRRPPRGMRRVAEIRPGSDTIESSLLLRLSRFPGGIPEALLSRLLTARGQDAIGAPGAADLLDAPR